VDKSSDVAKLSETAESFTWMNARPIADDDTGGTSFSPERTTINCRAPKKDSLHVDDVDVTVVVDVVG